jgi:succinate dehydrogenase/fumarate reductase flavoprotein subunit
MQSEADLVVLGFGAAGSAVALRAAELGAETLVLEKQTPETHTPSARMSGGHVMGATDAALAGEYLAHCAGPFIPRQISEAWARRAATLVEWLDAQGTDLSLQQAYGAEYQQIPGAEGIAVYMQSRLKDGRSIDWGEISGGSAQAQGVMPPTHASLRSGLELFDALARAVDGRAGVEVAWGQPARRLLRGSGNAVVGVETADGTRVRARHGVVLATGGYEFSERLKADYLKAEDIHFYGNPGNTGDGVRMAQDVGADLWHMNQMVGRAIGHFPLGDGEFLNTPIMLPPGGFVLLDRHGRRFANEQAQADSLHDFYNELLVFDYTEAAYPRIPCYWVFDSRRIELPLVSPILGPEVVGLYRWSDRNAREIERGWITTGGSVQEAVAAAGVGDPEAAAETVRAYNEACDEGADLYGRPPESMLPLDAPPFYCVPLYPGGPNTSGGPRRDESARILDPFGEPIPGLMGAGELGQAIGRLYPAGGCNLSEAFCFGQIAAETALAGPPVA